MGARAAIGRRIIVAVNADVYPAALKVHADPGPTAGRFRAYRRRLDTCRKRGNVKVIGPVGHRRLRLHGPFEVARLHKVQYGSRSRHGVLNDLVDFGGRTSTLLDGSKFACIGGHKVL